LRDLNPWITGPEDDRKKADAADVAKAGFDAGGEGRGAAPQGCLAGAPNFEIPRAISPPALRAAFSRGGLSSRQAEVLQRSASDSASDIRFDDQFEYINVVKIDFILFNFASRFGWTEIPLLTNNLFECAPSIRRPPQNELLCAPNLVLLKNKGYAFEPLRVIKNQTDRLAPRRCRPPAWRISGTKGQLDRIVLVFRRDLDHGCTLEV
jgi:hypothetical protein